MTLSHRVWFLRENKCYFLLPAYFFVCAYSKMIILMLESAQNSDRMLLVFSPEDRAVKIAVEKVAISVAVNGKLAEEVARVDNAGDPDYK